ncbi:MAG TPA: hypothetical protein VK638_12185 [Edaphobacter sp.]|nr:hypothetical protein [Edaphobacter sp.]
MSPKGARLYATTNTDSPHHYLYREVINNAEMADLVWYQVFTLDDNLSLDEETRDIYRRQYSGVFKKRFIDALWVCCDHRSRSLCLVAVSMSRDRARYQHQ